MTDPKNIVIKVKYTAPEVDSKEPAASPRMIVEWNIKRIAGALAVTILILAGLGFLLRDTAGDKTSAPSAVPPAETAPHAAPQPPAGKTEPQTVPGAADKLRIENQSSLPATSLKTSRSGRIRRAQLAYRITGKEPADPVGATVSLDSEKTVPVHYFTEIRGKTGQILFHEWIKDGQILLRHPIIIAAERWRTSSQRQFAKGDQGQWSVRTVDDKGIVMNEIHFIASVK